MLPWVGGIWVGLWWMNRSLLAAEASSHMDERWLQRHKVFRESYTAPLPVEWVVLQGEEHPLGESPFLFSTSSFPQRHGGHVNFRKVEGESGSDREISLPCLASLPLSFSFFPPRSLLSFIYFLKYLLFIYLAALGPSCSIQDLPTLLKHVGFSSLTRDQTWALCIGSMEF